MPSGRKKLSADELLARGTFIGPRHADRLNKDELLKVERPPLPANPKLRYKPHVPIDFDDLITAHYDDDIEVAVNGITSDLGLDEARRWAWDDSDELAIRNGCRFDLRRAMHFAYSIRNELTLWEGRWVGEPFILRTWQVECLLRLFGWVRPHPHLGWTRRYSKAAIWVPKKHGKMLALETPLPTPQGWTTIGEVANGDVLFAGNGTQCTVTAVHPIEVSPISYEVTFSNGEKILACEDHLWVTESLSKPISDAPAWANQWTGPKTKKDGQYYRGIHTTRQIKETLLFGSAKNHRVSLAPIDCDVCDLPIHPYVLGLWLGDGDSAAARLTAHIDDFNQYMELMPTTYRWLSFSFKTGANTGRGTIATLHRQLKNAGLLNNKHIPKEYLRASFRQRLQLLQGLMDTDGGNERTQQTFTQKNKQIIDSVSELLASLGIKHSVKEKQIDATTYYRINFSTSLDVFMLPRKLFGQHKSSGRGKRVHIVSVEQIEPVPMRCITVDSPDGTFLCGKTMIPTHNSPAGAAVALYTWRFDGVWKDATGPTIGGGQHVYCIARNGKQARIVWQHARNMAHHSPRLKHEVATGTIRTHEQLARLSYEPRLSNLTIVTGDIHGAIGAAEGLNAKCIICDEAHVVDQRMVDVVTDAGASQDEFLWFQISTYGSSEGYGKSDLDRGRDVAAGRIEDDAFFFRTYEAPQDASDVECGTKAIWEQANPNLGYTVSERQFEQAYLRSKDDPSAFSGFKQRRLNIWQRAANPLFVYAQWEQCAATIDKIESVGGGAGIDLAVSNDWAALALAWQKDQIINVWVKMWCAEKWAVENDHRAPFSKWISDGHLEVHSGGALDYQVLESEICDTIQKANSACLAFDITFGTQMAQNIGRILPYLSVCKMAQTPASYAKPTSDLKNAIKNGMLRHPNNPALNWQAGHVRGHKVGDYEKPIKDDEAPWNKIDGIQAICMAIRAMQEAPEVGEPYVGIV